MAPVLRGSIDMAVAIGRIEERLRRPAAGASKPAAVERSVRKGGQRS
jgi:hypothetical protein